MSIYIYIYIYIDLLLDLLQGNIVSKGLVIVNQRGRRVITFFFIIIILSYFGFIIKL
jgi:hypothetical protein